MSDQEDQERTLTETRLREEEAQAVLRVVQEQARRQGDSPSVRRQIARAELRLTMATAFREWIEASTPAERRALAAESAELVGDLVAVTEELGLYGTEGDETAARHDDQARFDRNPEVLARIQEALASEEGDVPVEEIRTQARLERNPHAVADLESAGAELRAVPDETGLDSIGPAEYDGGPLVKFALFDEQTNLFLGGGHTEYMFGSSWTPHIHKARLFSDKITMRDLGLTDCRRHKPVKVVLFWEPAEWTRD